MLIPVYSLMRLYWWTGWRPATALQLHRAVGSPGFAALYFGLVSLGYAASMSGPTPDVWVGTAAGVAGAGVGVLWAVMANGEVTRALERGETPARSWRDPSLVFPALAALAAIVLLAWAINASIDRAIVATWTWVVPGTLLLSGALMCANELATSVSLRRLQRRTRKIEVSLNPRGRSVYRFVSIAHKVPQSGPGS